MRCANGHLTTANQSEIRKAYLVSVIFLDGKNRFRYTKRKGTGIIKENIWEKEIGMYREPKIMRIAIKMFGLACECL